MKNNKVILTGLFLTSVISCSNFRPLVLTEAYLDPVSTTEVDYDDINFSYALFNQYASGLDFEFVMNYNFYDPTLVFNGILFGMGVNAFFFNDWDTITGTQARGIVEGIWKQRLIEIFFDRQFNRVSKKALYDNQFQVRFYDRNLVNFEVIIKSSIAYKVNVGSVFMAFNSQGFPDVAFLNFITFRDENNAVLQRYLLTQDMSSIERNYVYDLATILTQVKSFDLSFEYIDIPPFTTNFHLVAVAEFNIFTQGAEISIPDDVSGDTFGFEFVAVEWWNILGHLQNFAWWIVNKSPIAPVFEWLDTYIISWISGLITFVVGVFDL